MAKHFSGGPMSLNYGPVADGTEAGERPKGTVSDHVLNQTLSQPIADGAMLSRFCRTKPANIMGGKPLLSII